MGHCAAVVLFSVNKQRVLQRVYVNATVEVEELIHSSQIPSNLLRHACAMDLWLAMSVKHSVRPFCQETSQLLDGCHSCLPEDSPLWFWWSSDFCSSTVSLMRFMVFREMPQQNTQAFMVPRGWTLVWWVGWHFLFLVKCLSKCQSKKNYVEHWFNITQHKNHWSQRMSDLTHCFM